VVVGRLIGRMRTKNEATTDFVVGSAHLILGIANMVEGA